MNIVTVTETLSVTATTVMGVTAVGDTVMGVTAMGVTVMGVTVMFSCAVKIHFMRHHYPCAICAVANVRCTVISFTRQRVPTACHQVRNENADSSVFQSMYHRYVAAKLFFSIN